MLDADDRRAGAIILRDLALFNKASILLEEHIEPEIRTQISDLVSRWANSHRGTGEFDVSEDFEDLWVCPPSWKKDESEDPVAKFRLNYAPNIETDSLCIADLFGAGQSYFCFCFEPVYSWFGGKSRWNTATKNLAEISGEVARLGWINQTRGIFFRPVRLSAEPLARAWDSEDWGEALAPLEKALDALLADQHLFDRIISQAQSSNVTAA